MKQWFMKCDAVVIFQSIKDNNAYIHTYTLKWHSDIWLFIPHRTAFDYVCVYVAAKYKRTCMTNSSFIDRIGLALSLIVFIFSPSYIHIHIHRHAHRITHTCKECTHCTGRWVYDTRSYSQIHEHCDISSWHCFLFIFFQYEERFFFLAICSALPNQNCHSTYILCSVFALKYHCKQTSKQIAEATIRISNNVVFNFFSAFFLYRPLIQSNNSILK